MLSWCFFNQYSSQIFKERCLSACKFIQEIQGKILLSSLGFTPYQNSISAIQWRQFYVSSCSAIPVYAISIILSAKGKTMTTIFEKFWSAAAGNRTQDLPRRFSGKEVIIISFSLNILKMVSAVRMLKRKSCLFVVMDFQGSGSS